MGFSINAIGLYGDYTNLTANKKHTINSLKLYFSSIGNNSASATLSLFEILITLPITILNAFLIFIILKDKSNDPNKIVSRNIKWRQNVFASIFLSLFLIIYFLPLIMAVFYSFKNQLGNGQNSKFTLENYTNYWIPEIKVGVFNTFKYSLITLVLSFVFVSLTIYEIIYKKNKIIKYVVVFLWWIGILVSPNSIWIGIYLTFIELNFFNSIMGLGLVNMFRPIKWILLLAVVKTSSQNYNSYIYNQNLGYWFGYRKIFLKTNILVIFMAYDMFFTAFDSFNIPLLVGEVKDLSTLPSASFKIVDINGKPNINAKLSIYLLLNLSFYMVLIFSYIIKSIIILMLKKVNERKLQ